MVAPRERSPAHNDPTVLGSDDNQSAYRFADFQESAMRPVIQILILLLASIIGQAARGDTICVNSVAGLVQAVDSFDFQNNGTLTIKLVQGTYNVGSGLVGTTHTSNPTVVSLKLLGGYTAGCGARTVNPLNTTINAGNADNTALLFRFNDDATATVEGITFTGFKAPAGKSVLELTDLISDSDDETYSVRYCRFLGNTGHTMIYMSAAQMNVTNNLIVNNTLVGGGAGAVYVDFKYDANSRAAIDNNTIANNSGGYGVLVDTSTRTSERYTSITNNILWGNSGPDLNLTRYNTSLNPNLKYGYNIYGTTAGFALRPGDLVTNPQFTNAAGGNFLPAAGSPAINSGASQQFYGFPAKDLVHNERIVGNLIDRGAFEATVENQSSFLVTSSGDNGNNTSPTTGSLRAAIKAANASSQPFRINFGINGSCPRIVSMTSPMLDITGDVTIDGRTQSGWSGNTQVGSFDANLCLAVNGSGAAAYAFHVPGGASNARLTIMGMMFAGFTDAAVKIEGGNGHRLAGNQFGAVPFTSSNHDAIRITGTSGGAFIGGYDDPTATNLIAGSSGVGVYLDNAGGGSTLANNLIGFQTDGAGVGGNGTGVYIFNSPQNVLQYNLISNSASHGVNISGSGSSGNLLQYNIIGVNYFDLPAGNGAAGVGLSFGAQGNTIGAPQSGSYGANTIARNGAAGVWITPSGGSSNRVLANRIRFNGDIAIDLSTAGATGNQGSNPSSGPNHLQNYPILTQALRHPWNSPSPAVVGDEPSGVPEADMLIDVTGSLHSAPLESYRIDVYFGLDCDVSHGNRGVPDVPLGRTVVTADGQGNANFQLTVPGYSAFLGYVSATATHVGGDTSEVGTCLAVVDGSLPDPLFANGFE
jgi:trimeric autotransporter adhesin